MIDNNPTTDYIFWLLRTWRWEYACRANVPKYIIINDQKLRDIARCGDVIQAAWSFLALRKNP